MNLLSLSLFLPLLIAYGLFGRGVWPGEVFASILPQLGLAALAAALLFLLRGEAISALALIAAGAAGLYAARAALAPAAPAVAAPQARIVWANALKRPEALAATFDIARKFGADLVIVAETPQRSAAGEAPYVHTRGAANGETAAISIFSKLPIETFEILQLEGRKSVRFETEFAKARIAIAAVHPHTPMTPTRTRRRNAHLLRSAGAIRGDGPRLLLGDMNMTPWSKVMGRMECVSGLRWVSPGPVSTWVTPLLYLGLPIDNVLAGGGVSCAVRVGRFIGSDHYPLLIDVGLPPGGS